MQIWEHPNSYKSKKIGSASYEDTENPGLQNIEHRTKSIEKMIYVMKTPKNSKICLIIIWVGFNQKWPQVAIKFVNFGAAIECTPCITIWRIYRCPGL